MALFRGDIRSEVMQMDTSVSVILPYDRPIKDQPTPCKVVYLLHGIKLNSTGWVRWTNLETYAKQTGIAVVVPEGYRGFYTDMAHGPAYYTFLSQELPALCEKMFGISGRPEDVLAAGLSMGGYGALKLALRNPEKFGAAAAFSALCDPIEFATKMGGELTAKEAPAVWGTDLTLRPEDDLYHLSKNVATLPKTKCPRIYFSCGTSDALHGQNMAFKKNLEELSLVHTYEEWAGDHDWDFWEVAIQKGLDFFLKG